MTTEIKTECGVWRVYQLNDCDWWFARSMAEAKESAAKHYGCETTDPESFQDDAHELTDAELDNLQYFPDESRTGFHHSFREQLRVMASTETEPQMFGSTEF